VLLFKVTPLGWKTHCAPCKKSLFDSQLHRIFFFFQNLTFPIRENIKTFCKNLEIKSKPSSDGEQTEEAAPDFEEKVRLMMEIRQQVKEQAMANIDKAQERQKKNYDAKHQPLRFKEGDTVLLKNMRNNARKGGKLEKSWSGPYTVSSVLPKGLYKLQNEHIDELKTSFNSTRLKTYFHPVQSKPVKVDLIQQERDTILNQQRLDDTIINRSQNRGW